MARGALEVHFAVSDKVDVYSGKDAVSHIGFSVGDVGYNCGRNEGRDDDNIMSNGPYVAVKSPYRMDGFYLNLTDSKAIGKVFQDFVDGYLAGKLDLNGIEVDSQNISMQISKARLKSMWFTKTVQDLGSLAELKALKNVNFMTYERDVKQKYPVLNSIDFEEFEEFKHADTLRAELGDLRAQRQGIQWRHLQDDWGLQLRSSRFLLFKSRIDIRREPTPRRPEARGRNQQDTRLGGKAPRRKREIENAVAILSQGALAQ